MIQKFTCKYCKKKYKHIQSLKKHIRTKHFNHDHFFTHENNFTHEENCDNLNKDDKDNRKKKDNEDNGDKLKLFKCEYCNKDFVRRYNLNRHKDNCKLIDSTTYELEKKIQILEKKMLELDCKNGKENSMDDKQQINNITNINGINITNNITNNTVNNIVNIIELGNENLSEILSGKEKKEILKKKFTSLLHIIKKIHFNDKYDKFKNIMITNLRGSDALKYDKSTKKFITVDVNELIEDVCSARVCDIEDFFEEHRDDDDMDSNTIDRLTIFLEKLNDNTKFRKEEKKKVRRLIYDESKCIK